MKRWQWGLGLGLAALLQLAMIGFVVADTPPGWREEMAARSVMAPIEPAAPDTIYVDKTYNVVYGDVAPNATVELELRNAAGVLKGSNVVYANEAGLFRGAFYIGGVRTNESVAVDIADGDRVQVRAGGLTTIVSVPPSPATVDIPTRRVIGSALPYADVAIIIRGQRVTLTANFAGNYAAVFPIDLMPADEARIDFRAGPSVWIVHYAFAAGPLVRERENEVVGFVTPGATVSASLRSAAGEIKGTAVAEAQWPDGLYRLTFGEGTPIDIAPGDMVNLEGHGTFTMTVAPITLNANAMTDIVSGTAPANSWVRVSVLRLGPNGIEWHVRRAVADGAGRYQTSFAGVFDLQPGDDVWATVGGVNGATEVRTQPPFVEVDQYFDVVSGRANPGEVVQATLRAESGAVLETLTSSANVATGEFEIPFQTDIVAGHRVDVQGATFSTTVVVGPLWANALVSEDRMVIRGPANTVVYGWYEPMGAPRQYIYVTTDATGRAELTLPQVDMRAGDEGWLRYKDPNRNLITNRFRQPAIALNANGGRAIAWVERNAAGGLALYDASGRLKESADFLADGRGYADWWPESPITTGDRVIVNCCGGKTAEVMALPLTSFLSIADNTVTGLAPANSMVEADLFSRDPITGEDDLFMKSAPTGADGKYEVPFDGLVAARPGDRYQTWWQASSGNWLFTDRRATRMTVYRTGRAVYGIGLANRGLATILWTDSVGALKGTAQAEIDRYGEMRYTVLPGPVLFGDRVTVSDGTITVTVPVDMISVVIDPDSDTVAGVGLPNAQLLVRVNHLVGTEEWWSQLVTSRTDGAFSVSFGEIGDLLAGDEVYVYQHNSEGHQVLITQHALRLRVNQSSDRVWVWSVPGETANMTLRNPQGAVKTTLTLPLNPQTGASPEAAGQLVVDLLPGDVLEAEVAGQRTRASIEALWTTLDIERNRIVGKGPAARPLRVEIYGREGYRQTLRGNSDDSGVFSFDVGAAYRISAGDAVEVWYTDANGHEIGARSSAVLRAFLPLLEKRAMR